MGRFEDGFIACTPHYKKQKKMKPQRKYRIGTDNNDYWGGVRAGVMKTNHKQSLGIGTIKALNDRTMRTFRDSYNKLLHFTVQMVIGL